MGRAEMAPARPTPLLEYPTATSCSTHPDPSEVLRAFLETEATDVAKALAVPTQVRGDGGPTHSVSLDRRHTSTHAGAADDQYTDVLVRAASEGFAVKHTSLWVGFLRLIS